MAVLYRLMEKQMVNRIVVEILREANESPTVLVAMFMKKSVTKLAAMSTQVLSLRRDSSGIAMNIGTITKELTRCEHWIPAALISGGYIVIWNTSRDRPAMERLCGREEIKNMPKYWDIPKVSN